MTPARRIALCSIGFLATLGVVFVLGEPAEAYESYHDPNLNDDGYCASCHPGFGGGRSDVTHALHTGNPDAVTGRCDLCHTGSGRDNPLTMWSTDSTNPYGCTGCHGRNYGETIQGEYRSLGTLGDPKMSGYGLRAQHLGKGVTLCQTCHNDTGVTIQDENVDPPNYALPTTEVSLGGSAVDTCTNEDTSNDTNTSGLDNDGDGCRESFDADCGVGVPTSPGETAQVMVAQYDTSVNPPVLSLTYTNGCSVSDNAIEWGLLADVSTYAYSGQECGIGTSGNYDWNDPSASDSLFFLIVGNDGATYEGSYGQDGSGAERPEDVDPGGTAACSFELNVCNPCS